MDTSTSRGYRGYDELVAADYLVAMGARQVILEECFARLEGEIRADPATSSNGSHTLPNGLSASFERIINEQRDELFVFGPKVPSEN